MYQEKLIIFIRNNIYHEKLTNMNVLQVKKHYLLEKLDQEKKKDAIMNLKEWQHT